MALAPIFDPAVLWRKPHVLALAALAGTPIGVLGEPLSRWSGQDCHTSGLLAQGFTLEDVKNLLGHSSIVLTSDTYGHVLEQRQQQVARDGRRPGRTRGLGIPLCLGAGRR